MKTLKYYIVPALILLALFLADRCSAAEAQPVESCFGPALSAGKCHETAVQLRAAIRADGLLCDEVVVYALWVGHETRMNVACYIRGATDQGDYVSINGNAFTEIN